MIVPSVDAGAVLESSTSALVTASVVSWAASPGTPGAVTWARVVRGVPSPRAGSVVTGSSYVVLRPAGTVRPGPPQAMVRPVSEQAPGSPPGVRLWSRTAATMTSFASVSPVFATVRV
ncbi:hypothetical protein GCM10020220_070440 [Nonomuraea rubra]